MKQTKNVQYIIVLNNLAKVNLPKIGSAS